MIPAIMTQEEVDVKKVVDGFAAALLECARLGYVLIKPANDPEDTEFILTESGKALLEDKQVTHLPGERGITTHEIEVLKKVFREASSNDHVTTRGIKSWAAISTPNGSEIRAFAWSWGVGMRSWFERHRFALDDSESTSIREGMSTGSFLVALALFMLLVFMERLTLLTALMPVSVFLTGHFLAPVMSKRTLRGAREVYQWEAFRNFLTDFSSLDRASEKMLPMWDKYLVYATALGVSKEFSKQLSKALLQAPQFELTFGSGDWGTDLTHSLSRSSLTDFGLSDLGYSISTSLRDTAVDFHSMTKDFLGNSASDWDFGGGGGSSGGGGFGGGFGGGGGGGGGGGFSGAS